MNLPLFMTVTVFSQTLDITESVRQLSMLPVYYTDIVYVAEFVTTPTSVNATLGSTATFNCSATGIIYWIVNGSLLTELNQSDITTTYVGRTHFMNLSATKKYNNTAVVCEVILHDPILRIESSDPAVLRVQGMFCM